MFNHSLPLTPLSCLLVQIGSLLLSKLLSLGLIMEPSPHLQGEETGSDFPGSTAPWKQVVRGARVALACTMDQWRHPRLRSCLVFPHPLHSAVCYLAATCGKKGTGLSIRPTWIQTPALPLAFSSWFCHSLACDFGRIRQPH